MKDIMARESSDEGEVKLFTYIPVRPQKRLFGPGTWKDHSIEALMDLLLKACAGTTQTAEQIYEGNTVGTPYLRSHVRDAIAALEAQGKVVVDIPAAKRTKRGMVTLGKTRSVTFL
jgi:hypothetical protein